MSTLNATDLFVVRRGSQTYKVSYQDVLAGVVLPSVLTYMGATNPAAAAPAPAGGLEAGMTYVLTPAGTLSAGWTGIAGIAATDGQLAIWEGAKWELVGNTGAIPQATETVRGIIELATAAETTTGTDDTRAVHPAGLKVELDKKAPLASPALTGTPTAPTAAAGTNTTQLATTAFVTAAVDVENTWDRTGTTLSPKTAGDGVSLDGHLLGKTIQMTGDTTTEYSSIRDIKGTGDARSGIQLAHSQSETHGTLDLFSGGNAANAAQTIRFKDRVIWSLRYDGTMSWGTSAQGASGIQTPYASILGSGHHLAPAGTAALPSYSFSGNSDTGMWSPAANTLAFSFNQIEKIRILPDGKVGIGTSAPLDGLDIRNAGVLVANTAGTTKTYNLLRGFGYVDGAGKGFGEAKIASIYDGVTNKSDLILATSTGSGVAAVERLRITADGKVGIGVTAPTAAGGVLQLAGGITFPATPVASTDPNTLDDYEEGTFAPTIVGGTTAGTGTYTTKVGRYTKVGNRVIFQLSLTWSAHTGTGAMRIAGLPFANSSVTDTQSPVSIAPTNLTAANSLSAFTVQATTLIYLRTYATNAAESELPIDTAASIRVAGVYEAA